MRVRERRKTDRLPLHNFDGKGGSLLAVALDALKPMINGNDKKSVPGRSLTVEGFNQAATGMSGVLLVGEYGLESKVIDVNDGKTAFEKAKHHAEQIPFYFRLYVPAGGDQGVLVLQRLGNAGITGIVRQPIHDKFKAKNPTLMLDIAPMVPDFVLARYLHQGKPKSISFIRNSIPPDLADKVSGKSVETKGRVEVTIKAPSPWFFQPDKLAEALKVSGGVKSVYTFDQFEPDKITLKVEVGGRERTINLNNHANLRASFDVSDNVIEGKDGYPTPESVAAAAQTILTEVADVAGIKL